MATFVNTVSSPLYGELWEAPDGQFFYLVDRKFPRSNRMVCLMENLQGYLEYFVFPY
jgi:hypothetical protein